MKWEQGSYWITDAPEAIDFDFVTAALHSTYWAKERPRETIEQAFKYSVVFSLFSESRQIGLSRVVGDRATFAWVCDVFVDPAYRGRGLGKWLLQCLLAHPICDVRMRLLATKDAHGLYRQYGFTEKECMAYYHATKK